MYPKPSWCFSGCDLGVRNSDFKAPSRQALRYNTHNIAVSISLLLKKRRRTLRRRTENLSIFLVMMLGLFTAALISTTQLSHAYAPLAGITARSVKTSEDVDLSTYLTSSKKTMLVLGTYAADFNAIEYAQRLRYYLPDLQKRGVSKIGWRFIIVRLWIPVHADSHPSHISHLVSASMITS